jgi:predicted TIM-barrel enzyme
MIPERSFTRTSILARLQATLERKEPIISVSAGVGIIAKCAEVAGADLIQVIASGKSRHLGVPTTVNIGNATSMTLAMLPEIDNVVERTPIIGGAEATDGSRRRLGRTIEEYQAAGFDGISNSAKDPTANSRWFRWPGPRTFSPSGRPTPRSSPPDWPPPEPMSSSPAAG